MNVKNARTKVFRNKIALTTHSYSHNRKYLENTEDYDINFSQNVREFDITIIMKFTF